MIQDNHHIVQCEVHSRKAIPFDAAVEALGIIRKNGIKDAKTNSKTGYVIKWAIDVFGKPNMKTATEEAYQWIKQGRGVSWCHTFTMQDKKTKECFSVDLDVSKIESTLPLTETDFNK